MFWQLKTILSDELMTKLLITPVETNLNQA